MATTPSIEYFSVDCTDDNYDFPQYTFDTIEEIAEYFAGNKTDAEMNRARIFNAVAKMAPDDNERNIDLTCFVITDYRDVDDYDADDIELPFILEAVYTDGGNCD